jgi:hypothetical protein
MADALRRKSDKTERKLTSAREAYEGAHRSDDTSDYPFLPRRGPIPINNAITDKAKISIVFSRRTEYEDAKNVTKDGVPSHRPSLTI